MAGYETEAEARESVRNVIDPAIYAGSVTQGNRALLKAATAAAGIELGAYDRVILDWLADWEVATCGVVAGLIFRAAAGSGWELTIGQALADAIAWRTAQGAGGLNAEQIGLYLSAARALGIPGDVAAGPGDWHPDAVRGGEH